jgi:signal transduction histidine kinase
VKRLRASLFWKLMLAFVLVVLIAVGAVALIARQTATSEFQRLRQRESEINDGGFSSRLTAFYAANGSWDGVSLLLGAGAGRGQGQSGGSGPPLRLADADGVVILNTVDGQVGQRLSPEELSQGEPIKANGEPIGILIIGGRGTASLSQAEQEYLERVQLALVTGALVAIGVAAIIGFLLFQEITAPLGRLTQATEAVADGDLSARVPVPAHDGDEIAQLGVAFNRMAADLAHADRLRRDMTADIAHELRTPLTVIQGNLEAIIDGVFPADPEHLEPVLRKTQLLNRLVEDLRTLALADAGELRLHTTPMDISPLIQRTVDGFRVRAKAADVELIGDVPPHSPPVEADASKIEQVLGILLDNALRHTPAGGKICVELRRAEGECWLSVRDTGDGIPPQELPHVFERYYRGSQGGTGLGLPIAQAIIEAHGGRIWVESQAHQGTSVIFALPFSDQP